MAGRGGKSKRKYIYNRVSEMVCKYISYFWFFFLEMGDEEQEGQKNRIIQNKNLCVCKVSPQDTL